MSPLAGAAQELARLDGIASQLEAKASEADREEPGTAYVLEVAKKARAAHAMCTVLVDSLAETPREPEPVREIPRVACTDLSLAAFRRDYVALGRPVVITGLPTTEYGAESESCEWLRKHAGSKKVTVCLNGSHKKACGAAGADLMDLNDHLDRVFSEAPEGQGTYLYDCSVPIKLPSLMGALRIPRYFVHDYMQRTMSSHLFSRSWPSLFVASKGTKSALHLDQWHGNFWMVMVRGTKRWVIWEPEDVPFLAPDWSRGTLDPAMPDLAVQQADPVKFPFLPYARSQRVDLGPGEVLFVPGGCAHIVENMTPTVAFAGNFVDSSNIGVHRRG